MSSMCNLKRNHDNYLVKQLYNPLKSNSIFKNNKLKKFLKIVKIINKLKKN